MTSPSKPLPKPRPRLHRILERFGRVLCSVFVDPGPPPEQADIDAALVPWCKRNP